MGGNSTCYPLKDWPLKDWITRILTSKLVILQLKITITIKIPIKDDLLFVVTNLQSI